MQPEIGLTRDHLLQVFIPPLVQKAGQIRVVNPSKTPAKSGKRMSALKREIEAQNAELDELEEDLINSGLDSKPLARPLLANTGLMFGSFLVCCRRPSKEAIPGRV